MWGKKFEIIDSFQGFVRVHSSLLLCFVFVDDFISPCEHRSLVEGAQLQLQLVSRKDVEHNAHCGHAAILMILITISMIIMICQPCQTQHTLYVATLQKKQEMYQFIILIITQSKKQIHDDNK